MTPSRAAHALRFAAVPPAAGPLRGDPNDVPALLARAAEGDEAAWREIVALYARRVFALARSRRLSEDAAEEIAQSVFVTVASQLARGAYSERGRFESWLFRVAINRVRDELRRERRQAQATDPVALSARAAPPAAVSPDPRLAGLRSAIDTLADADREIIDLRHQGGLSFKQIADLLNIPMGTALARHHRALRKLREHIETAERAAMPESRS